MARFLLIVASLACLAAGVALARPPSLAEVWNGAQIEWRDIRSGVYESSRTGRPVLMLMHASWCPACKTYRRVFYDERVVEASRDLVMILVDVDAEKETNGAFAPDGTYVPRTIFLDSEGNVQSQLRGASDPAYPHSIDIKNPEELLDLMRRARDLVRAVPPRQTAKDRT